MVEVEKQGEPLIVILPEKAASDCVIVMEIVPDAITLLLTHIPFQVSANAGDVRGLLPPLPQPDKKVMKTNEAISRNMYLFIILASLIFAVDEFEPIQIDIRSTHLSGVTALFRDFASHRRVVRSR
jgi:hypothetical protein